MLATFVLAASLLSSDDALHAYGLLLALSRFGTIEEEEAGFLLEDDDGRLRLLRWQSRDVFKASYSGRIPKGTIAVVHTHPFWSAEPSEHDRREARRIGLPIIVVTRNAVIAAQPDGTITRLTGASWTRKRGF